MKHVRLTSLFTSALVAPFLLTQCAENPADNVDAATVGDATEAVVEKAAEPEVANVTYVFTDGSKIGFTGSKVTGSHSGGFSNFTGQFEVAGETLAPNGNHRVRIDMSSTWSDNDNLTEHLLGEDFFHTEKFPLATFELGKAELQEGDNYVLSGTLDLHGVTKSISFPATITGNAEKIDLNAEFSINRMDFGIVYPGKADDLIRDEVVIALNLSSVPGDAKPLEIGGGGVTQNTEERGDGRRGRGDGDGRGRGRGERPSPEEMKERIMGFMTERMNSMDANGDGAVTREEYFGNRDKAMADMKSRMAEWGRDPSDFSEERFNERFEGGWDRMSEADSDEDGSITMTEMETGVDSMVERISSGDGRGRGGPGGGGGPRGGGGGNTGGGNTGGGNTGGGNTGGGGPGTGGGDTFAP